MKLQNPVEPIELKAWMQSLKESNFGTGTGDWDSYVVWAGNKLPKYLWDHWKGDLKPAGITWQKFLRLLRYRTDVGVMWYKGALPWNEFVIRVLNLITGPIGKGLKKDGAEARKSVDLAEWQIPPPSDWEKFERLCSDLWRRIWSDPNLQRNGRSGQRQHGVDIFGTILRSGKPGGIQCKKKDATIADDALDEGELRSIVEDAKSFSPPLSELVIAFTGRRDAKLQQEARRITEGHRKHGLFDIHVYSWDDILEAVGDYNDILRKHFHQFAGVNVDSKELNRRLTSIENLERKTFSRVTDASVQPVLEKLETIARNAVQSATDSTAIVGEHSAEIDHARDLLDAFKPKEALDYLEKLEKRIWASANNITRFRILTNKGAALSSLGNHEEAGKLFIQAYQYNADEEKALSNRAVGHLLLGQLPDGKELAEKVIQKNPANSQAYAVIIHCIPDTEPMEKVIQSVPANIRKTEQVAHAIAVAARQRGNLASCLQWFEVALQGAVKSKRNNPDLRAELAATLLESLKSKHEVLTRTQLIPEDRDKIRRAIDLLTESINDVSESETINYRRLWFVNRSTAYELIGELDSALFDIEAALRTQPDDPALLKQKGVMLHLKGDTERAISILSKIVEKAELPEASLILGGILHEKGDPQSAIKILEESLARDVPDPVRAEEKGLLIQLYATEGKYEQARGLSASMRAADSTDVLNLVIASRIEKSAGDLVSATKLLDDARGYITEKTSSRHIIELADDLYAVEKYSDAWPLYERIADPRVNNRLVNCLLYSYYRADEFEKALDLCQAIPSAHKPEFVIQVELSILEEIKDLKQAAAVAERYLETHPDDLQIRVRLAMIHFRREDFDRVDALLKEVFDANKLSLDAGFRLTQLYRLRGMTDKALQTAYELRRAHFANGEAHLKYVSLILAGEQELDGTLSAPDITGVGTAVHVETDAGRLRWYLLEDRPDLNAAMNELSVMAELGKKLLGKKVGEAVVVSQGSISTTSLKIVEIKSKYVYSLHESLELLPERFPETKGIERVTSKTGPDERKDESIEKMLGVVSRRQDWVKEAEKLYQEFQLTVGAFAEMIGKNVIDLWSGLPGSKLGIRCCLGTVEEREEALALLEKNKISAIDITALFTASQLDLLPFLEKTFEKVLISQSTLDLLQTAIIERKGIAGRGYMTIWKEKEKFFREEITAERISKQSEHLERLKEWAKQHCDVPPSRAVVKLARQKEIQELIGSSFLDAILIAQEHRCPLYTEDFGTRALAKNEFKVLGVWTQVVAMQGIRQRQLTEDEYNKAVIRLALLNYRHTTINGATILEAAKQATWSNASPFTEVLETFRGSDMEIRSAVGVFADFVFLLSQQPIFDFQREALLLTFLDVLTDRRNDQTVLRLVRTAVGAKFRILPLTERRVQQVISAWELLRNRVLKVSFDRG